MTKSTGTNNDLQYTTQKTKDWATRTLTKTEGARRWFRRVSSYCFSSGTLRVTILRLPLVARERLTLPQQMDHFRFSEVPHAQPLVSFAALCGPLFVCLFWIYDFLFRISRWYMYAVLKTTLRRAKHYQKTSHNQIYKLLCINIVAYPALLSSQFALTW